MTIYIFISIILIALNTSLFIYEIYEDIKKNRNEKNKTELAEPDNIEKINILLQDKSIDKINELLDKLISDAADKYTILVLVNDVNNYINQEQIKEMTQYITIMVSKNMTTSVKSVLKLIYNIDTDKDLNDVLDLRIKLFMIGYVTKYNKME